MREMGTQTNAATHDDGRPRAPADKHKRKTKKGKGGDMYHSLPNDDSVYEWKFFDFEDNPSAITRFRFFHFKEEIAVYEKYSEIKITDMIGELTQELAKSNIQLHYLEHLSQYMVSGMVSVEIILWIIYGLIPLRELKRMAHTGPTYHS